MSRLILALTLFALVLTASAVPYYGGYGLGGYGGGYGGYGGYGGVYKTYSAPIVYKTPVVYNKVILV